MEFACNAYCFPHDGIDDNAAAAAEAGFAGIEPSFAPEALMEGDGGGDGERVAAVRAAAEENDLAVPSVLSPTFWEYPLSSTDDDVRAEGLAREAVKRIQNLRKDAGFEVTDRIEIAYRGSPKIADAVTEYGDWIRNETLALELQPSDTPAGEAVETFEIDDEQITLGVRRAEADAPLES